jgi:thiol-disulfide isomerase/thioredoxin
MRPLAVGLLALLWGCSPRLPAPGVGPALTLVRPSGEAVDWSALRAARRPALLAFATVWCEACRAERPALTTWATAHRDRLDTLYVFSGQSEGEGGLAPSVLQLDSSALTVLLDPRGDFADAFGVRVTPTLLVLDADGRVLSTHHRVATVPEP